MRYAVLDLGSNTFHLLIVEAKGKNHIDVIYKERSYVKLASGGIEQISEEAYQRGLLCLAHFKEKIDQFNVNHFKAFGTATIRSASNGAMFVNESKEKYGIEILSISGDEEARLITIGVKMATELSAKPQLIMDIGGGSVEFIFLINQEIFWAKSFNVGISILKNKFHRHDPMTRIEIESLDSFLETELKEVSEKLKQLGPIEHLIGASGSFEVLKNIFTPTRLLPSYCSLSVVDIIEMIDKLISLNHDERINHLHIPNERVDLIVVASLLMRFIINKSGVSDVLISDYALKEGAIGEMMDTT